LRVSKKTPGFGATLMTFATSALWHGFHPGYYSKYSEHSVTFYTGISKTWMLTSDFTVTFVSGSLVQNVAKKMRRHVRPFFFTPDLQHPLPTKRLYDLYGYLATQASINFISASFLILNLSGSIRVWKSLYFYPHVGIFLIEGLFAAGLGGYLKKMLRKRAERAGLKLQETKPREAKVMVSETGVELADEGGVKVGRTKLE
jgi:lysophospholipid acyltransferase